MEFPQQVVLFLWKIPNLKHIPNVEASLALKSGDKAERSFAGGERLWAALRWDIVV